MRQSLDIERTDEADRRMGVKRGWTGWCHEFHWFFQRLKNAGATIHVYDI